MSRTSFEHMSCSLARVADIIGDKWTLLIVRDAFYGLHTFSQFQKNLGVARNVLADRLEKLVAGGVLSRTQTRPGVERFDYRLTDRGRELFPVVIAMMQWGDKWIFGAAGEPVRMVDKEQRAPIQQVGVMSRDGRFLQARDVTFEPGPSASPQLVSYFQYLQKKKPA